MSAKFGMVVGAALLASVPVLAQTLAQAPASRNPAAQPAPAQPPAAATGAQAQPIKSHQTFDIVREGSKIGSTVVDVERKGDTASVKVATNISVKIMYIEAYRYVHTSSETWKGSQLIAYKGQTDDNGTKHTVNLVGTPDKPLLEADGKRSEASKLITPASFWSKDLIRPELFDPKDGTKLAVQVKDLGDETINVRGTPLKTRHIRTVGDFERDLWFDGDVLVRMRLVGTDKSIIVSEVQ
jgi:hypothetical protein